MASKSRGPARTLVVTQCLWLALSFGSAATAESADEAGNAGSRQPLTLSEARARARAASPELSAARDAVAAARGHERQAGALANPSVVWSHERTSRSGETNREHVVLVEQPFEIAGQRGLRQRVAGLRREASEARLALAALDVDFEVGRAFADTLAAERSAVRTSEAARAFARARDITEARRERGDASGYEARRTGLEAARYAVLAAAADREVRSARARLRSLIAASIDDAAPLPPLADEPLRAAEPTGALDALRSEALARHPAIRSAELARRALEVRVRLTRREIVPDPTVGLGYKREEMAGVSGDWDGLAAQLTLPIPLWDRRAGARLAAEAEARGAAAELRRVRRQIALGVERAWHDLHAASQQLAAIRPQLGTEARAALDATRAAYDEGEITLVEWLDAVRAYHEAEATYAGLLADHLIRRAALERAVGGSRE